MQVINVAKDFTRYPSGRYKKNGDSSGEAFRELFLETPLSQNQAVVVELDGTIGYGSSFLEEAFGGLVRKLKVQSKDLYKNLTLKSNDESLLQEIKEYIEDASDSIL